jgi:hypothetical protein
VPHKSNFFSFFCNEQNSLAHQKKKKLRNLKEKVSHPKEEKQFGEFFFKMVLGGFLLPSCKTKTKKKKKKKNQISISTFQYVAQQYKRVLLFPYQNSLVAKFVYTFFFSFFPLFLFFPCEEH